MISKNTDAFEVMVKNSQTIGADTDVITESGLGTYREKNGNHYISYKSGGAACLIKYDGQNAVVTRTGEISSRMCYTHKKHTDIIYSTPYGNINMTLYTTHMSHSLDRDGGTIRLEYVLDTNGNKTQNSTTITIKRSQ